MQVDLYAPKGADLTAVRAQYPDLCEDESDYWIGLYCWIGKALEDQEDGEDEWLTHEEAVEFCGFCEGAIEGAETIIEGNGGWAQSMMRQKDFDHYAVSDELKQAWRRESDAYWRAYERGRATRANS